MGDLLDLFTGENVTPAPFAEKRPVRDLNQATTQIRTDLIRVVWNSRGILGDVEKLAESIKEIGLLQPIVVLSAEGGKGYRLISGHRRLEAVLKLGWDFVQANVLTDLSEGEIRLINLTENVNRKNIRLYDLFKAVFEIEEKFGTTPERLAHDTGLPVYRVRLVLRIWPKLSTTIKTKWSKIEEREYEPNFFTIQKWSALSWSEQNQNWKDWARDEDCEPQEPVDPKEVPRLLKKRGKKRKIGEVKLMLRTLGKSRDDEAQRRALLWVLGKRSTL